MKKLIVGLTAALLLAAGLVTVSGVSPASAADYPPSAPSQISSPKPVTKGKPVKIKIASGVVGQEASGTAKIKFTKLPKGLSKKAAKKIKKAFSTKFSGGTLTLPKSKFKKKGTYKVKITIGKVSKTVKIKIK